MYYVCLEEEIVVSVLNYLPEVPGSVEVIEIQDSDYKNISNQTHYFDVKKKSVQKFSDDIFIKQEQEKENAAKNAAKRDFLSKSDWQVLRHLRETALGIPTSLSAEQYLNLEQQRQEAAKEIIDNK